MENEEYPAYSVLMSLYAKEKPEYLFESIQSMLMQTIPPSQIVVVMDGPLTSDLVHVLMSFVEQTGDVFSLVENKTNIGLGLSLNKGLEACRYDLVARMDTDDISKPQRCEKQLRCFMEDETLSIVGSNVDEFIGSVDNVISTRSVPSDRESIYNFAKRRSAFNHPSVMYRKSAVLKVGGYSDLRRNQDVDLFGRMLYEGCNARNIPESLLFFRTSDDLAKRRRSWENTSSYITTINSLRKIGYSRLGDVVTVAIAQVGMFVLPIQLQHWVYKTFLR